MSILSTKRFRTAMAVNIREYRRNLVFVFLMVFLPFAFITVSILVTPVTKLPVQTQVDGLSVALVVTMPEVHGVVMTPVTGGFIAGLSGLFLMQSAKDADGRLVLAGYRPHEVILARLSTLTLIAVAITIVSTAVMAMDFMPKQFWWFTLGTLIVSLQYGLIGMFVGVGLGRLAGMYMMLFVPMMDIGVFQDPMFVRGVPAWWMKLLPGYHPIRMMMDAGFTPDVDTIPNLLYALCYLSFVLVLTTVAFNRAAQID